MPQKSSLGSISNQIVACSFWKCSTTIGHVVVLYLDNPRSHTASKSFIVPSNKKKADDLFWKYNFWAPKVLQKVLPFQKFFSAAFEVRAVTAKTVWIIKDKSDFFKEVAENISSFPFFLKLEIM